MPPQKLLLLLFSCYLLVSSCQTQTDQGNEMRNEAKIDIALAEKNFEKMAAEKGIAEAFWFYADSNAVIKRQNDTLIKGKDNIRNYYSADFYKNATVKWSPDFVEASPDGQMGYTYGNYVWQSKDSTGKLNEFKGVFHTVWKRQKDGSWRYTWD